MRRVLHRTVYLVADSGDGSGQTPGVRCVHLDADNLCSLYLNSARPVVCITYETSEEFCGSTRDEALELIAKLEVMTVTT